MTPTAAAFLTSATARIIWANCSTSYLRNQTLPELVSNLTHWELMQDDEMVAHTLAKIEALNHMMTGMA